VIQCVSGTCSGQRTYFLIELDTDQDASTGAVGGNGLGFDYLVNTNRSSVAAVGRFGGPFSDVPVSFVTDGVSVTVPLSMIGNDDGRLNFRILAYGDPNLAGGDVMPDDNLPPAHIQ
jgi:hypothetical protein